jgi:hypothetical protein
MKAAERVTSNTKSVKDLLADARQAESDGDPELAAGIYNEVLKKEKLNEQAFDRLMIIYRKLKDPGQEMNIIEKGIETFESKNADVKIPGNKKILQLSTTLGKATGLFDKKGKSMYDPEPIARWKKRLLLLKGRIRKTKKNVKKVK